MLSELAVMRKTRDTPGPGPISAPTSEGTPTFPHCSVGLIAASITVLELPTPTNVRFWSTANSEPEVKVYTPAGMFIVSSASIAGTDRYTWAYSDACTDSDSYSHTNSDGNTCSHPHADAGANPYGHPQLQANR